LLKTGRILKARPIIAQPNLDPSKECLNSLTVQRPIAFMAQLPFNSQQELDRQSVHRRRK